MPRLRRSKVPRQFRVLALRSRRLYFPKQCRPFPSPQCKLAPSSRTFCRRLHRRNRHAPPPLSLKRRFARSAQGKSLSPTAPRRTVPRPIIRSPTGNEFKIGSMVNVKQYLPPKIIAFKPPLFMNNREKAPIVKINVSKSKSFLPSTKFLSTNHPANCWKTTANKQLTATNIPIVCVEICAAAGYGVTKFIAGHNIIVCTPGKTQYLRLSLRSSI